MHESPLRRPFPVQILNPFHGGRAAWRIGTLAEYVLSLSRAPRGVSRPKLDGIKYITMAGKAHLLQLRESLISLERCWSAIPQITILSDGSWEESEFRECFNWWPYELEVCTPDAVRRQLKSQGHDVLEEFTKTHPLALKLGFIVSEGLGGKVMFVDSDILWLKDPVELLRRHDWDAGVAAAEEPTGTYNQDLAQKVYPVLLKPPFINAGMVLLQGQLFKRGDTIEHVIGNIGERSYEFNEQTIIAIAVKLNGQILPASFLINDFSDPFKMRPIVLDGRSGLARHYVRFMRHLMYRDALILRWRALLRS